MHHLTAASATFRQDLYWPDVTIRCFSMIPRIGRGRIRTVVETDRQRLFSLVLVEAVLGVSEIPCLIRSRWGLFGPMGWPAL